MKKTPGPKSIYLFRHPETEAPKGTCYGNSDVLPNKSQLQNAVLKINRSIQNVKPDIIYTSPLSRCKLLAKELAGKEAIIPEDLIREIDFGRWEMIPWDEIPNEERETWGKDYINNKIHGGENFFDVQKRVVSFWEKIIQTDKKTIFVVAHAGLYRALLAHLLDASPYKIFAIEIDYGDTICIQWDNESYYKIKFL
jgi:alpha-ribazole phosphatase